jgi:hypothetical protein
MDRFGRRSQESGSHPQDRGHSGSKSQQTLPPFRDVFYSLLRSLAYAESALDHSRTST